MKPFFVVFWFVILGLTSGLSYAVDRVLDGQVHWWVHYALGGVFLASVLTWAITKAIAKGQSNSRS